MLKLIGVILVLAADFLVIKYISDKKKKEINFISDTLTFLKMLTINIKDYKRPLFEAVITTHGEISKDIDSLITNFSIKDREVSIRESLISEFSKVSVLDHPTKKIILEYLHNVGRTTKEGMEDMLEMTAERLKNVLDEKTANEKKSKKLVSAGVYAVSILIMILLY